MFFRYDHLKQLNSLSVGQKWEEIVVSNDGFAGYYHHNVQGNVFELSFRGCDDQYVNFQFPNVKSKKI